MACGLLTLSQSGAYSQEYPGLPDRIRDTTVTIVSGGLSSTSARMVHDLGAVLNDDNRRILTVLGYDGFHTVSDLLHLRGVDIALVHEDAFETLRREGVLPDMDGRLRYIARLHRDPIFIVARSGIEHIGDLRGKTVNLGPGSLPLKTAAGEIWGKTLDLGSDSTSLQTTQALVLDAVGLDVTPRFLELESALAGMRDGSLDAAVLIGSEFAALASRLNSSDTLRVVPINQQDLPANQQLPEVYKLVEISGGEYADFLPPGSTMTTVSVPLVMITSNWERTDPRYEKVEQFTVSLFENFASLLEESRSAAWRSVNIGAPLADWKRFGPAEEWLAANAPEEPDFPDYMGQLEQEFEAFLSSRDIAAAKLSPAESNALFWQFLSWPQNPVELQIPIHRTEAGGIGPQVGSLRAMNTEINIQGRNQAGLLLRPKFEGMEPDKHHAFHIYDDAECGVAQGDASGYGFTPGFAPGTGLWLAGAGLPDSPNDDPYPSKLPDLVSNDQGSVTREFVVAELTLSDLVNRAIVIHADQNPSSERWACAAIK